MNELPIAVPWFNLIVSALALVGMLWITIRRSYTMRRLFINLTGLTAILILLAGALFQAGILSTDAWVLVGSGGRIAVLVLVLLFVFTPEDQGDVKRNLAEDKVFGDARRDLERDHRDKEQQQ